MEAERKLKDAKRIFSDTIEKMLDEYELGIEDGYSAKEVEQTVAICSSEFAFIWADLMQWVNYGDDEREKSREIVRLSLQLGKMWH